VENTYRATVDTDAMNDHIPSMPSGVNKAKINVKVRFRDFG